MDITGDFLTAFGFLGSSPLPISQIVDSQILIFFFLLFSTYVSEDLTCIGAGVLAGLNIISFELAVVACVAGVFTGDLLLYGLGAVFKNSLLRISWFKKRISEKQLKKAKTQLETKGVWLFFICRFIPGTRLPTYVYAGMVNSSFGLFSSILLLSSVIWVPIIVFAASLFGKTALTSFLESYSGSLVWLILLGIIFFYFFCRSVLLLAQKKSRYLVWAKIYQITHFEFWPMHFFYFPVYLYLFFLGMRYSSLTLFSISNPIIRGGGIRGESKSEILSYFEKNETLPQFFLMKGNLSLLQKIEQIQGFMKEYRLDFPIAIKPDIGERGNGFFRVSSEEELSEKIQNLDCDMIVQENIEGEEFGVLYIRKPSQKTGRIFSLSKKAMLFLKGDGESTLESLILEHPRAVLKATLHFKKHAQKLDLILKKDEIFPLVDLGTHSMGATFFDYNRFLTPELEKKIDEISQSVPGFYVGRFDLRTTNLETLRRGENLKILELNLVTGEPVHIYHPGYSIFTAYKTLFLLWEKIFEIGAENQKRGFTPLAFKDLWKMVFKK